MEKISLKMYLENKTQREQDYEIFEDYMNSDFASIVRLVKVIPEKKLGVYEFVHRSFFEYFTARVFYKEIKVRIFFFKFFFFQIIFLSSP